MKLFGQLKTIAACGALALACGNSPTGTDNSAWQSGKGDKGDKPQPAFVCQSACVTVCSQADVAAIAVAWNNVAIESLKLTAARAQNAQLRALAEAALVDHVALGDALLTAVSQAGITPNPTNTVADRITQAGARTLAMLRDMDIALFDVSASNELFMFHVEALGIFEHLLIPSSTASPVSELLQQGRIAVGTHLGLIVDLQTALGIQCGGQGQVCPPKKDDGKGRQH